MTASPRWSTSWGRNLVFCARASGIWKRCLHSDVTVQNCCAKRNLITAASWAAPVLAERHLHQTYIRYAQWHIEPVIHMCEVARLPEVAESTHTILPASQSLLSPFPTSPIHVLVAFTWKGECRRRGNTQAHEPELKATTPAATMPRGVARGVPAGVLMKANAVAPVVPAAGVASTAGAGASGVVGGACGQGVGGSRAGRPCT